MVQARPARRHVAADRALVLARRAGPAALDRRGALGRDVLQEFQLAIADRDEGDAQAAGHLGLARLVDGAVFVGGEAFDGNVHLHVGLRAFQRIAEAAAEHVLSCRIVGAGDADVVEPLDEGARRGRQPVPRHDVRRDARALRGRKDQAVASLEPLAGFTCREAGGGEVRRTIVTERDVVHAGPAVAADERIARSCEYERGSPDAEQRTRRATGIDGLPRHLQRLLQSRGGRVGIVHHGRDVGERSRRHRFIPVSLRRVGLADRREHGVASTCRARCDRTASCCRGCSRDARSS